MKKLKKVIALLLSTMMVMAMGVTAFAADNTSEASTVKTLTNPRFVKQDGSTLAMKMGTKIVKSATWDTEDNEVTVVLQSGKVLTFTGNLTEASYASDGENLISDGELTLDASRVVALGTSGLNGIKLDRMYFSFTPFAPPGMPNPTTGAFTCDEFN